MDVKNCIDLHMHSTESDGTDTPLELMEKAAGLGLKVAALTDHDTLAGLDEAEKAAQERNIRFVRGCEISTSSQYGSFHVLGLFLPKRNVELEQFLERARRRREGRNDIILEKLRKFGIDITAEEVKAKAASVSGRPHIARLLVEKGHVKTLGEAFSEYLDYGAKAYVPKQSPTPEASVEVLARTGATVVLAHPMLERRRPLPPGELEKLVARLAKRGLSGLEVWHSAHSPEQMEELQALARKYDLAMTGGSDYHGTPKPEIKMGSGKGNLHIPEDVYWNLVQARKNRGLPC